MLQLIKQRDPTSRCRKSLAPRSYRISKSKTRGLGHLQNSKDSLIPKVDMLVHDVLAELLSTQSGGARL